MAKIEKPQAVDDLEEIVGLCDAIMVARYVFPQSSFLQHVLFCYALRPATANGVLLVWVGCLMGDTARFSLGWLQYSGYPDLRDKPEQALLTTQRSYL